MEGVRGGGVWSVPLKKDMAGSAMFSFLPDIDSSDAGALANCSINFQEGSFHPTTSRASGLERLVIPAGNYFFFNSMIRRQTDLCDRTENHT